MLLPAPPHPMTLMFAWPKSKSSFFVCSIDIALFTRKSILFASSYCPLFLSSLKSWKFVLQISRTHKNHTLIFIFLVFVRKENERLSKSFVGFGGWIMGKKQWRAFMIRMFLDRLKCYLFPLACINRTLVRYHS